MSETIEIPIDAALREGLTKAAATLRPSVKTRDVGRCEWCGNGTSSGMNPLCYRCAIAMVVSFVDALNGQPDGSYAALRASMGTPLTVTASHVKRSRSSSPTPDR